MSTKRKSPEDDRASEAFHPHYYAGESRVYAYTPIIAAASSDVKPVALRDAVYAARSRYCRTVLLSAAQRLHVNAERSEPKESVYAEWHR
jgi:hypothetical protein